MLSVDSWQVTYVCLFLSWYYILQEPYGDILLFLTGQDDIDVAVKLINEEARSGGKNSSGTD